MNKELEEMNRTLTKSYADMLKMYGAAHDKKILDLETKLLQRMNHEITVYFNPILEQINRLTETITKFRINEKSENETIRKEMSTKAGQLRQMMDELRQRLDKLGTAV